MSETLSDGHLEEAARAIDAQCLLCHHAEDAESGAGNRQLIRSMLTELAERWDAEGAEGTKVMNTMKQACDHCLADGRTKFRLYSLTCGIATRLPEHLHSSRPQNTDR